MHHVISRLERIIDLLDQFKHRNSEFSWQDNPILKEFSSINPDALKEQLLEDALSYTTNDALKIYVSNMQAMLTVLLDKLYTIELETNSSSETEIDDGFHAIISELQQRLEKGFLFLEQSFKQHFDATQPIPFLLLDKHKPALQEAIQKIRIFQNAELPELINMIAEPVEKFVSEALVQLSLQELSYYERLLKHVYIILLKKPRTMLGKELSKALIQINFNDAAFFEYYVRGIKMLIENITDNDLRIKELGSQEKYLKQLVVHPGIAFHKHLHSIQVQLITWIEEEINFLKTTVINQQVPLQPVPHKPDDKIHLSVSVNVLAFLLKVFVAGGIITNTNQSDVIRFFARHCKTSKQEDISFDSLYNKYHQPNSSTIKITRDLFATLMQLISKLS